MATLIAKKKTMRFFRFALLALFAIFLLPAGASTALWAVGDRPTSWRTADWSSAKLLPVAPDEKDAVIHILAARTGGLKGALSVHSWIVIKRAGASHYERYDKVGWGNPVRRNAYSADARWYSNDPFIVKSIRGARAERLIPMVEAAIAGYPHAARGQYRIWPGPNSNSFVAHVLREVPDIGAVLPPTAVGRDYLPGGRLLAADADWRDFHVTLFGYAGFSAGLRSGVEIHLLGLVAGLDLLNPGIKIPGFGRIGF